MPVRLGSVSQLAVGEPMMVSTGGADGDIELTHLLSKWAVLGFSEYHIEDVI